MADMSRGERGTVVDQMQQRQEQQQHWRRYSMSNTRMEKDEDLSLFQDMQKRERTHYLHPDPEDAAKSGGFSDSITAASIQRKGVGADLLNSDVNKNDYDWLLTPPGTPLFPSLDLDSPAYSALQQGLLMNRSLAAIKTSRIASNNHAGPASSKLGRGSNPSPSQRPSTPQNGHRNSAPQGTQTSSGAHSVRPSTPTRSSTSASKYPRPSTPTRQSAAITSTGRPSSTALNRPSTPTNRPSTPTGRPSTPTLRRSSSSSTSTQPLSTTVTRGNNPSPTRSTASSGTTRGISPVRSQYRGSSPSRGSSPAPSMRRPSSPRAHPIIIPDGLSADIPPNLRTTSDRPSSAHRRHAGYGGTGQTPDGLDHRPSRQPSSPNLIRSCSSTSHGQDRLSVQSGRVSSDDDSSYEVSSQSAVSSRGLTPERGLVYGQRSSVGNEDWRNNCPNLQGRRSPSHRDSPHFGPSKKTPDSASRNSEIQRALSGGFRPLTTKNSISTFYSTRANSLLRRPVTPGSTASSEQGASVAPDSEGDEDLLSGWGRLELSLGGHADILVLDAEDVKLKSWDSLQHEHDLKLLELKTIHNEMHEADSYETLRPTEALVEESSPYSVSSSSLRELKTGSNHNEEHSECPGAAERLCLEQEARRQRNLQGREQGREQRSGHNQPKLNSQGKESNALVPELWHSSGLDLFKESRSEKGIRALSLINGESCGYKDDQKDRESVPNLNKDAGSVPNLNHVKGKLLLLSSPDLSLQNPEWCKKLEETGSNADTGEELCVCNHTVHPGMYCKKPGCECSTGHEPASKVEVQSCNEPPAGSEEVVWRSVSSQNGVSKAREKNIWYVYRNSEEYDSTSKCDAGIELEDHSLRGYNPGSEKESQLGGSHHMGPANDITQALELFNQQGVDEVAANHEGGQSDKSRSLFMQGLNEGLVEIQREPSSMQQEKEESRRGVLFQENKSVETAGHYPQSKSLKKESCQGLHESIIVAQMPEKKGLPSLEPIVSGSSDLPQLKYSMSNCASRHCLQELKPGSSDISRSSDSKVGNLPSLSSSQECGTTIDGTLSKNQKAKDAMTLQGVVTTMVMADVLKRDDGDSSSSSEELLEYGIDLTPQIVLGNHVSDVTRSGKDTKLEQAKVQSDHGGREWRRLNKGAPETKKADFYSQRSEVENAEHGTVAFMEQIFVDTPDEGGGHSRIHSPIEYEENVSHVVSDMEATRKTSNLDEIFTREILKKAVVGVGTKAFDRGLKEVISYNAQIKGPEEVSMPSPCVEKKPISLYSKAAFEASYSGRLVKTTGKLQVTLLKSESSKSSGSFHGSSLDVSQSTDTISSCPSNSSWEDPQFSLSSSFRDPRSSPTNAHVYDVHDLPSFIKQVHKQGAGMKQGMEITKSSSSDFDLPTLVKYRSISANPPEGKSLLKEIPAEESCLDYFVGVGMESKTTTGQQMMTKNLHTPKDPETKKVDIMIKTHLETDIGRKSSKTPPDMETVGVEDSTRFSPPTTETVKSVDSVLQLPDVKKVTLPNVVLSPVKEEIIENTKSPGPNAQKHLSSFKFGRKKTSTLESERKPIIMITDVEVLNEHTKQVSVPGILPCKFQTPVAKTVAAASNGPQLSKFNSARVGSMMRVAVESGDDSLPGQVTHGSTNRRIAEELNGQSRFSNITVRPGSVSEQFEWERSSLEEVSCSSGSSKGTDTASLVSRNITLAEATDRILFCSSIVHDLVYEAAELASAKERNNNSVTVSPHLDVFPKAGIQTEPEKYQHSNQNGHVPQGGESVKPGSGNNIAHHSLTYNLPSEGFEKPGRTKKKLLPMQSPKAQVMCSLDEEPPQVAVKEDVVMHPAATVRLKREVDSNAEKVSEKCFCVIL